MFQPIRLCNTTKQTPFETTPEGVPAPDFTPWRAARQRARGWSPSIQCAFIAELTRIGSFQAAARAVGRTPRHRENFEKFAASRARFRRSPDRVTFVTFPAPHEKSLD
jgi:hypothetical protein